MRLPAARFLGIVLLCSACKPTSPSAPVVHQLFDGKSLDGWRIIDDWVGEGAHVGVRDGAIYIADGNLLNGIARTAFPEIDGPYEMRIEAMRLEGRDIFLGVTFPVPGKNSAITFVAGGWGGQTTGLSNIDGLDAMENATGSAQNYEDGRWYAFRFEVSEERIDVWMDGRLIVGAFIARSKISLRPGEVDLTLPFGFFTYNTVGAIRKVEIEELRETAQL